MQVHRNFNACIQRRSGVGLRARFEDAELLDTAVDALGEPPVLRVAHGICIDYGRAVPAVLCSDGDDN